MNSIKIFHQNIDSILKSGFKLDKKSTESECLKTAKSINTILNTGHSPYVGHIESNGKTIYIETTYFDPVLSVEVSQDSIFFIPLIDSDWHGAFFEVLKILFLWQTNIIKKEEEKQKEQDSDFEWI